MGVICGRGKDNDDFDNKVAKTVSREMNFNDKHIELRKQVKQEFNSGGREINRIESSFINKKDNFYDKIGPKRVFELGD